MPPAPPSPPPLANALRSLGAGFHNALSLLPGKRPGWVVIDLGGAIVPREERTEIFGFRVPARRLPGHATPLDHITSTLASLGRAAWLSGVLFRIDGLRVDPATAYALRTAILGLGRAGKKTAAYLTTVLPLPYYVASATDEIIAPESADLGLFGIGVRITFLRDALARFGVRFEKLAIDEYKNAYDTLVRQDMSAPQREQLEALLDRFEQHFSEAIGASRRISEQRVRALWDEGITSAEEARAKGLIDRVAYEDEVIGAEYRRLADVRRFLTHEVPPLSGGRIGVLVLTGMILGGPSRKIPLPGGFGKVIGAESVVAALRAVAKDNRTAAVVVFVDSGGGSALASDLIGHELQRLAARKPVVGVMGAVAASGGYYVLTHASRILAAPTTVTGSIGVITGKMVLEGFFDRFGLQPEIIQRGRYALLHDASKPFADHEKILLERHNAEVYERFVARVASGRNLSKARVNEIGRGRIWAGVDAEKHGLVDELGDLALGIERAREIAGLPVGAPVVDLYPPDERVLPTPTDVDALVRSVVRERTWLLASTTLLGT